MSPIIDSIGSVKGFGWGSPSGYPDAFYSITSWSNDNASSVYSFSFTSIPQTYSHLQLRGIVQQNAGQSPTIRFNNDDSNSYSTYALNSSTQGNFTQDTSNWWNPFTQSVPDNSSNSGQYAMIILDILNYNSPNIIKTLRSRQSQVRNTGGRGVTYSCGEWKSTSPITTITVLQNNPAFYFTQYSQFDLYGIKGIA